MWEREEKGCGKNSNERKLGNQGANGKLTQLNVFKNVHGEQGGHFGSNISPE